MTLTTTATETQSTNEQALVYTVDETAELLKVSLWTVKKLIRERRLGSVQIGTRRLILAADLTEYLRELRLDGKGVRHGA